MIKLNLHYSGEPIWINEDKIIAFTRFTAAYETDKDRTKIRMDNGTEIEVEEIPETIVYEIMAAKGELYGKK